MKDPKERFSDRVDYYIKYRPTYPSQIIKLLESKCGLTQKKIVADIGSGTGILSKIFLNYGNKVFAVEPNREMRLAAEKLLKNDRNFVSINAAAENTGLKTNSIDLITAGQSFHWFNLKKVKREFNRILRNEGWIVLIWNVRQINSTPFMMAYEELLLKHALEYQTVSHKNLDLDIIGDFFAPTSFEVVTYKNNGAFDYEGLLGRVLSSSYAPKEGDEGYKQMISDLKATYKKFEIDGTIEFEYKTELYYGQLKESFDD